MEQNPTEDIGSRHIPSLDDVEGHGKFTGRGPVEDADEDGDDDVEGHGVRVKI